MLIDRRISSHCNAVYEFYNLQDNSEKLHDLAQKESATFTRLKEELLDTLADANRPYESN